MTEYRSYPVNYVKVLLADNKRLIELTTNDGIEIGSFTKETGLRGEIKNKDAELDAADDRMADLEATIERLTAIETAAQTVYDNAEEMESFGDGSQCFEIRADIFHELQKALEAKEGE